MHIFEKVRAIKEIAGPTEQAQNKCICQHSIGQLNHVPKPNICGAEKQTPPLLEGTAKSQRVGTAKAKAVSTRKGEEWRTLKQLTMDRFLNILSAKVFCLNQNLVLFFVTKNIYIYIYICKDLQCRFIKGVSFIFLQSLGTLRLLSGFHRTESVESNVNLVSSSIKGQGSGSL